MDNIKVSATFILRGTIKAHIYGKNHQCDIHKAPKYKECKQSISMTEDAYKEMMSTPIKGVNIKHWKKMSENQRISEHLKEIQHSLRAKSFDFVVYND